MGDELLIDLVRRYDAIYNIKSKEYRDASLRSAAWEEIAKLLDKPVEECKDNWNKLRNCFNNAMKRRKKKSGQAGKIIAPWRYEEQMAFLKPYLEGRHTAGNLDDAAALYEDSPPLPSPESIPYADSVMSPQINQYAANFPKSQRKSNSSDNYMSNMMEMMRSSQELKQKKMEMDDIDHFFLSMAKTVKQLPKADQIEIKMDLHKAVSQAQLKQLERQERILSTPITIKRQKISHSHDIVTPAPSSFHEYSSSNTQDSSSKNIAMYYETQ